jgi:outer membrane scaffolding protein for murein synthesis (MipA/OmpV family)
MKYLLLVPAMLVSFLVEAQENPILLGAGLRARPAYDGSSTQHADVIPVIRYYGKPWFARTTQGMLEGGVRSELAPEFWAGAQLAYEAGRKKSESAFLASRNEPDLDVGASAGLHLEWDRKLGRMPINFLLRARQHLDTDRGGQADLRITAGVFSRGGLQAGVFGQATYASANAMLSMYGIHNAGLMFLSAGLLGSYDVSRHWVAVGSFELRSLRDDAAHSPLVERTTNYYASAGLAYRF